MSATSCNVRVLRHKAVASDIRRLTVALPKEGPRPHAGQFYMLRCWGAAETPVLSPARSASTMWTSAKAR